MISAANHLHRSKTMFDASLRKRFDNRRIALRRRIRVNDLFANRNLPLRSNRIASSFYRTHHRVAPRKIRIADIERQMDAARNAVHRSWEHVANANGGDRID